MPATITGSATTTMVTSKAPAKRFELPALDFKFASLTEGTDIPPPLPSPVEEVPPKAAAAARAKPKAADELKNGVNTSSKINGARAITGATSTTCTTAGSLPAHYRPNTNGSYNRRFDDVPASPTLSARPGSIRRLFSRNLLNTAYANAEAEGQQNNSSSLDIHHGSIIRPDSRSTASVMDERRLKRSSGWFRRLRGGGLTSSNDSINGDYATSKRASMVLEESAKPAKPSGPPPPMIPELAKLKAKVEIDDDGSLGSDLFKNIK